LILNRGNSTIKSRVDWSAITNSSDKTIGATAAAVSFKVRDIQARADLPVACGHTGSLEIPSHGTVTFQYLQPNFGGLFFCFIEQKTAARSLPRHAQDA
jgi:hypothetical protein